MCISLPFSPVQEGGGKALLTHSNEFDIQSMKINLPKVRWFLHS